ncbi:hypothetical protein RclHR1_16180004 [Rhizophagus clarus]|uniref:Uncharacterized protein n=1 Tax=Rhizophagus clarus TaxID=94130 RepID=A0A2Z6R9U3_9GLOM|nr:hypothetical protein RclHR1_16180004 [Rhizophagus clarus]
MSKGSESTKDSSYQTPRERPRPSLTNYRNFAYNILKYLEDDIVGDKEIPQNQLLCVKCLEEITVDFPKDTVFCHVNTPCIMIALPILIKELSSETSQDSEVMEKGTGDFFDLYNSIINMEGQEEIAKRDVIKSYFNFGKALDDCFNYYKKDNPKRTAQALVNKKVWEQLPNVSDDALRKKKERALKIFELFNEIGEDKIQKIKSFSASSISKLD